MKNTTKTLTIVAIALSNAIFGYAQNTGIVNHENVELRNERTINTTKLDFSPTFFEDGVVFLSSNPEKENNTKIKDKKISEQTFAIKIGRRGPKGTLNEPEIYATELTSLFHEGPLCFDKTTENVFFSRNNSEGEKLTQVICTETKERSARQQIYTAHKVGDKWSEPKKLTFNRGEYAYRHPTLSLDGKKLYFSSNCPGGLGAYDIWVSTKIGEDWGEPVNAGKVINTDKNEGFPFIHADGTLLFGSDGRKDGLGGLDIYYALADKGKNFAEPVNMGTPFNTETDDFGMILDLDRKNGYLTSNRVGGNGTDDIYSFSSPEPIINPKKKQTAVICVLDNADKSPIVDASVKYSNVSNVDVMDLSKTSETTSILEIAGEQANPILRTDSTCKAVFSVPEGDYLVNVAKDGYNPKQLIINTKTGKDIYYVYLEKGQGDMVEGILKNDRGLPVAGALVTITDPETGETQTVKTDSEGKYTFAAKPGKKYAIAANKPNHDPIVSTFETPNGKIPKGYTYETKIKEVVSPLSKGRIFELTNVYYNFNDASLRPDAKRDLEALVTVMNAYPEVEIELGSHTDCRGSDAYNDDLSQRRAESVVRYLVEHGVTKNRMTARGYGEHKLRNQCADAVECTEDDHQRNRRTEVMITQSASNAEIRVVDKEPEYTDPMPGRKVGGPAIADGGNSNGGTNDPILTSSDPNGLFWIVAGSFNDQKNAIEQQVKLLNKGLQETTVEYVDDIRFYRVVVSKQTSMDAAEQTARNIKNKGIANLFVVKK